MVSNGRRASERPIEARLLVVEDDANIVELLSASLRYAGFEVAGGPGRPPGAAPRPANFGRISSCWT